MKKLKIQIGKRYGKLVIVEKYNGIMRTKAGRAMTTGQVVVCKCDCGKDTLKPMCWLKRGTTKSCGCSQSPKKEESSNWRGYKEISGTAWSSVINSAKWRKIKFDLTVQDAWKKFIKQDKKCALSGLPIKFGITNQDKESNASLDRIDSSLGYTKNNIQWVTKEINRMKMDLDEHRFIELCRAITIYNK
jgi:hypothetical protein